ncbi:MAG: extracellular solute-binding protein [Clostridia bacterium]|nr:extracellular solute-binding protein [Clostridia bacterium]
MRRIGIGLCALALLCSMLVMPVSAAPSVAPAAEKDGSLTVGTDNAADLIGYNDYVAANPGDYATDDVTIPAVSAGVYDATVGDAVGVTKTEDALIFHAVDSSAEWTVNVPKTGWYKVAFTYSGVEDAGSGADMELGLLLNGKHPFSEAQSFVLPRTWVDVIDDYNGDGTDDFVREDPKGNQFAPEQAQVFDPKKAPLRDLNGFVTEDLMLFLTEGQHSLGLVSTGEPVRLLSIHLDAPTALPSYDEQVAKWHADGIPNYDGKEIVVETELRRLEEDGTYTGLKSRTDRSVIGLSDNSNPAVKPSDAFTQKVNYIGGSNWSLTDESIVWTVRAPKAGLYKVGFHYRQNYLVNASSYRSMKINGVHQYAEMTDLAFAYKNGWAFMESFANGDDILVYLNEGDNEVELIVTLGAMNEFSAQMEDLTFKLGVMYRDIIAIVGETPDKNTDYELFARVPDLAARMEALRVQIGQMIDSRKVNGKDIDDNAAILQKMDVVLERMLKKQYEAQNYKSNFYDSYSSLTAQLQDMKTMALDLDVMVFAAPETKCERNVATFWESLVFGFERFIASFLLDYNTSGGTGDEDAVDLTIWVNWSRDQTLVLNSLINSHFTAQHKNINVTVRMTNASLLQGIMSGNGPDCSLSDSRTTPVNLAMRGALVDLSQFEDYNSLFYGKDEAYDIYNPDNTKYFAYGADEPYKYEGGVYGLPATQQFYMMFYRTDIFEQYGLVDENGVAKPPKTWDEFLEYASVLMLNNMQVGLPYVALTDIWQTNGGVASLNIFPTLLQQKGLSLYNEDQTGTSFNDPEVMQVFEEWTDFYTKYNLPKEYSFFNRFRIGLVPMAIQTYGQYSALSAAAPEIKGKWAMAEIPGYMNDSGEIVNTQAGFGSACMILEDSEHHEEAWELLKWWMSTDTQYRYAVDIESILGVAGRYTSANVNATLKLDWGKGANDIIANQWHKVQEVAEIPGGYYVSRAIDQAFWNVLTMNENPKDMMKKWGEVADVEITTKIEQYKKEG